MFDFAGPNIEDESTPGITSPGTHTLAAPTHLTDNYHVDFW